jgi:hypothetical protein
MRAKLIAAAAVAAVFVFCAARGAEDAKEAVAKAAASRQAAIEAAIGQ